MASYITYHAPKNRFEMVPLKIIDNFDSEIVGIYCKLACLSSGKSLRLDWISKKIGIGEKKMRKAIVLLEEAGYISRTDIRDKKGHISGWNYQVFTEPIEKEKRTSAGKKKEEPNLTNIDQVGMEPNLTKSNQVGNGHPIISNNDIIYNNNRNNSIIDNPVINKDIDKGSDEPAHKSDDDIYMEKMRKRYPRIMRMEQPLTLEQAKKLKERFDRDLIAKVLDDMENWKPLLKTKVSAYRTLSTWCQKELERS